MPSIEISKLKVRRGTDTQRKQIIFDQGELGYTTDTNRLFIGSGSNLGGVVVGSKIHNTLSLVNSLTSLNSQIGDVVYVNGILYKLTNTDYTSLASWENIGAKLDPTLLSYNGSGQITIADNTIPSSKLKTDSISGGLISNGAVLTLDYSNNNFSLSGNKLIIKNGGVDQNSLNSNVLSSGLIGGSGNKISIDIDTSDFRFVGNKLTLQPSGSLEYSDLDYNWFDSNSLTYGLSSISIASSWLPNQVDLTTIGHIPTTNKLSIYYGTLSGSSTSGVLNITNTLSSIFNGSPSQSLSGAIPGLPITRFNAINSSGGVVTLSSSGFITFEGPNFTKTGNSIGRFAIPIFTY